MNYQILALLDHCYSIDLVLKLKTLYMLLVSEVLVRFFFFLFLFSVVIACIVKLPCNRL